MLIDNGVTGHRSAYFNTICDIDGIDPVLILPEEINNCKYKNYIYKNVEDTKRSFKIYFQWLIEILKIANIEKPDIIHFLYGDLFYKYFGFGLFLFRKFKVIVTIHEARPQRIQILSLKSILKSVDRCVVHSEYMKKMFESKGVKKLQHIEYPCFHIKKIDKQTSCSYFGLDVNVPVLVCLGSTSHYKGLDILLEALNGVTQKFQLLVAGCASFFDETFIINQTVSFCQNVVLYLKYLTDDEFMYALNAADVVVLPYRKSFHGASGPLAEGVCLDKCIIGPNYGTIGNTIKCNDLGYTFQAEDVNDLRRTIELFLSHSFKKNSKYSCYKSQLDPEIFKQKYMLLYASL